MKTMYYRNRCRYTQKRLKINLCDSMRCKICNEESTGEYCRVHSLAMENLKETYKTWKKAMDIDWKKYLDAVRQNKNSGEWVVELCEHLLEKEVV